MRITTITAPLPHFPDHRTELCASLPVRLPARHPAHHLQHLAHLHELLQQPVHFLDRRPAASRDPLAPAPVDDLTPAPLVRRHRADHRFDTPYLLVIGLLLRELLDVAHAREHPDDLLERTHLFYRLQLVPE